MSNIETARLAVMLVSELLIANKKILAVKVVRLIYDCGLVRAKNFVDEVQKVQGGQK